MTRPADAEILANLQAFIDSLPPRPPQPAETTAEIEADMAREHRAEERKFERGRASSWDMDRLAERRDVA